MKRVWNLLVFTFVIFCLFLFKPREDVVFAALNKSQCIRLFEKNKDFELCVEESLRYTGTYAISKDTVFLFYQDQVNLSVSKKNIQRPDFKKIPPIKLLINKSSSRITAADGPSFSAEIYLDLRHLQIKPAPIRIRLPNSQKSAISAVGSD